MRHRLLSMNPWVYRMAAALIWVYTGIFIESGRLDTSGSVANTAIAIVLYPAIGTVAHLIMALGYRTPVSAEEDTNG